MEGGGGHCTRTRRRPERTDLSPGWGGEGGCLAWLPVCFSVTLSLGVAGGRGERMNHTSALPVPRGGGRDEI